MKFSLHPAILTTFWLGLLTIQHNTPYPEIQNDLPPILHSTVKAQAWLGWDQLYHGHVSHFWEQAIDQLNHHLNISSHYIVIQMLKTVWTYILALWTICNQHLHHDAGCLSLPNYHQAVITMYKLHQQLPPELQEAVFHCPLEEMLETPPHFYIHGLNVANYIQQQLKAAKKCAKLNTPDIHLFFSKTHQ